MGKGVVKLGEGQWAVKDGNLLAAKETNGRFKNAEFTVARGTDATYVGRDGLIKRFSSGLANEVANGDFELGDNGDWTLPSGWSISNNQLVGNDPSGFATVANVFYANKSYRLDIDVAERDSGSFSIISNSTDSNNNATPAIDSTGIHTFYFHIGTISLATLYVTFGGDFVGKINSITVRDIEDFDDRPRIDFTDNTDGHLLLEPESTNLLPHSENFSSSNWSHLVSASVDPNVVVSPDGTQNASRLNFHQGSTTSRIEKQIVGQTTGSYTFSVWAKSATNENVQFEMEIGSAGTGTVAKTATSDWQRFEITGSVSSGTVNLYPQIESYTSTNPSIYIWGAQFEKLSYATSYIPTNGSTVTRDAETCTGAGEAADFNSEEGVLYAEIAALADDLTNRCIALSDGTADDRVTLVFGDDSNKIRAIVKSDGSTSFDEEYTVTSTLDYHKVAIKYKVNDFALWIDGVERFTDTSGSAPIGLNELAFDTGISILNFYGKCKAIRVYKETDGIDLGTLTSL